MKAGKEQAIRRGIVQLKLIQSVRRDRTAELVTRNLAFGVYDSISHTTATTGKPGRVNAVSGWSAVATAATIAGGLLLLAAVTISVLSALSKAGA